MQISIISITEAYATQYEVISLNSGALVYHKIKIWQTI